MNNAYTNLVASIKSEPIAEVIVFDGYSGLGYKNPDIVKETMYNEMKGKIGSMKAVSDALGIDSPPLYVVAGATADGIGMCYDVADRLKTEGFNIQTVGIVSSAATIEESWGKALPDEQAKRLNHLVVVDDPNNTWQVLNEKGQIIDMKPIHGNRPFFWQGRLSPGTYTLKTGRGSDTSIHRIPGRHFNVVFSV